MRIYLNTLVLFFSFCAFFYFVITVFAVGSNSVTTQVGNPTGPAPTSQTGGGSTIQNAPNCPIPSGVLTCGTKNNPVNGPLGMCGHCGVGYGDTNQYLCSFPGNDLAIDIQGADGQEIELPKIASHDVRWTFDGERPASPAILVYSGVDTVTQDTYLIQFHHAESGSGNSGTHMSGEKAGNICGNGCNKGHVHVQLVKGNDWVDPTQYMCN